MRFNLLLSAFAASLLQSTCMLHAQAPDDKVQQAESGDNARSVFPNTIAMPFEVHSHLVFVEAELNGKKEEFILDSGSPVLVINKSYVAAGEAVAGNGAEARGVNGKIEDVGTMSISSFKWGGLQLGGFSTTTMNLAHLEKATHHNFAGLIGYDVFKNYEVTFNYKDRVITLRKTDKEGNIIEPGSKGPQPLCTVPIEMSGHVPIVKVKMGAKEYRMGLDCGASDNLLYQKYYPDIEPLCARTKHRKMEGADKAVTKLTAAKISTATIGTATFTASNTAFSDESLDQLNAGYGLGIDGLMGYEFLKQHVMSVNFRKREMSIY